MDKDTLKKNTDENLDKEVPKSLTFVQHPSVIKSNPSHQPIPNEKTEDRFKQKNSSHHLAEWYNNMQSAFEADMLELRATLQMEFQTTLQTERQGYEAKVAELNETLEKAQHQIFKFKRQMEWKKGSMCALSDQMVKFNVFKLKNFVYFIWKQKWRGLKHLESKYHWAILYHQKWVQRKVVWALRNAVVLPWQQSFEKRVRVYMTYFFFLHLFFFRFKI
ncbi:hypothetical protein HMI54_007410 [Coelomomyces lativittatus]|nr:hypothetical protein HMI54_007410 [Coelomomyces lativittatus]